MIAPFMTAGGWVADVRRTLTHAEREALAEEFSFVARDDIHALELALTQYRVYVAAAAANPTTKDVRQALARVGASIRALQAVLRTTEPFLEDQWSDVFSWPGHHRTAVVVPACDLTPLRDELARVEVHAWARVERLAWTRKNGRPSKGELRWFVTTLAALYDRAITREAAPPSTAIEIRDHRSDVLRFLTHCAALVNLRLPKNVSSYLPPRKPIEPTD